MSDPDESHSAEEADTTEEPVPDVSGEPEELRESPTLAMRIRHQLNYSVFWLSLLAVPTGLLAVHEKKGRLRLGPEF